MNYYNVNVNMVENVGGIDCKVDEKMEFLILKEVMVYFIFEVMLLKGRFKCFRNVSFVYC